MGVRFVILPDDRCLVLGIADECTLKTNTTYELNITNGNVELVEIGEVNWDGTGLSPNSSVDNMISWGMGVLTSGTKPIELTKRPKIISELIDNYFSKLNAKQFSTADKIYRKLKKY
jgi:hypothetical protein